MRLHRGAELDAVRFVAGHDRQLHFGLGKVDVHPFAVVLDVDDVGALSGHELEQS